MTKIASIYIFLCLKVENELVDLIDELLERDAGTVNSTIIGMSVSRSWINLAEDSEGRWYTVKRAQCKCLICCHFNNQWGAAVRMNHKRMC